MTGTAPSSAAGRHGELRGRVAIVTGASRGIGNEIAATLARAGAHVVIADIAEEAGAQAAEALRAQSLSADACCTDVSRRRSCQDLIDHVAASAGRLDVLVNNAGIPLYGPSETFPEADWRRSLDVMLSGPFFAAQEAFRLLSETGGGSIVSIASITGMGGWPMRAAYNAAKAGLIGLTQVLATEWAHRGIRVNAISPGNIPTDMMLDAFRQGVASREQYERRVPAGHLGRVEDIARAALFLASDRSSYVTGANLRVDGGWVPWANPGAEGFPPPIGRTLP